VSQKEDGSGHGASPPENFSPGDEPMSTRFLVLLVLALLAAPASARKPKPPPPPPPPKPMRIGVFYDARSITAFGERGLRHVGPLLVERQKILFANSGIDPILYQWELVYRGALPADFVVEDPCDFDTLLIRAVQDKRVLDVLKQNEIAVPFFLFSCHDVKRRSGVTPIVPRTAKDYTRNSFIGFAALLTNAVYNPDMDALVLGSDVAAHEFGHAAGGNHPIEQTTPDDPTGPSEFPWARGILIPQGPGEPPRCDVMGVFTCIREPWYSNTAFPGRGNPQADVARAIVLNWNRLADIPKVRERWLY
jgi:hypothetical protein